MAVQVARDRRYTVYTQAHTGPRCPRCGDVRLVRMNKRAGANNNARRCPSCKGLVCAPEDLATHHVRQRSDAGGGWEVRKGLMCAECNFPLSQSMGDAYSCKLCGALYVDAAEYEPWVENLERRWEAQQSRKRQRRQRRARQERKRRNARRQVALWVLGTLAAVIIVPIPLTGLYFLVAWAGWQPDVGAFYAVLILLVLGGCAVAWPRLMYRMLREAGRVSVDLVRETGWTGMICGGLMVNMLAFSFWWSICHILGRVVLLLYFPALLAAGIIAPALFGLTLFGPGVALDAANAAFKQLPQRRPLVEQAVHSARRGGMQILTLLLLAAVGVVVLLAAILLPALLGV